jgi:uncharacterized protein YdbL (DUF1318 family)
VNISTPEPVKIDVTMRADIYTHDGTAQPPAINNDDENLTVAQRRFDRRAEIQDLKNNRMIGEGNDGLLSIREAPQDEKWAEHVKLTVAAENADRTEEFNANAEALKKPLDMYIKDFARKAFDSSFPGEWVQKEDGTWAKR